MANPYGMTIGGLLNRDIIQPIKRFATNNPLNAAAIATSPVPVLGDVTGLLSDASMYYSNPEERNLANYGMSLLGILPFLPAASVAKALTPAQEMAQKVIDLLKSGKSDEVTDAMLEASDPVYLAKNYDLPMDTESRMARAREMGFDVDNVMYHGTNNQPYAKVNVNMGDSDRYKTGFYSTDNPDVADTYASKTFGGSIMPVVMRRSPDMVVDGRGANWNRLEFDSPAYAPEAGDEDLYFYFSNIFSDNAMEPISTNTIARERRFDGDSAVLFENIVDRGGSPPAGSGIGLGGDFSSASNPSNVRVDFYPNSIRSKFARFDPRLENLGNINAALAGLIALPVVARGLLATEEEENF